MAVLKKAKILVQRSDGFGDVLMTTPIVRKLFNDRHGYCDIDVRTSYVNIYRNNPYVHQPIPRHGIFDYKEYSLIINFDNTIDCDNSRYIIDNYAFYAFGTTGIDDECDLFTRPGDRVIADMISQKFVDGYIVIHMKRGQPNSKNVPTSFWEKLIGEILGSTNLGIIQIGMPEDLSFDLGTERLIDLKGKISIHKIKEIMETARCFVGMDSGPFHIARTTSTNMAIFFTIARPENVFRRARRNGLFKAIVPDIDCFGCLELGGDYFKCHRGDHECVNRFDLDAAIGDILKLSSGR